MRGAWKAFIIAALAATWIGSNQALSQSGVAPDGAEPNDTPEQVLAQSPQRSVLTVGKLLSGLNFHIAGTQAGGDIDWFYFYGKGGSRYQITTAVIGSMDTEVFAYGDPPPKSAANGPTFIGSNDNYEDGNRASRVTFRTSTDARYWIKVWSKDPAPPQSGQTYSIVVEEVSLQTPTATRLPDATRTPIPGKPDLFEPNGSFDTATDIKIGTDYAKLNFMPFAPQALTDVDNDYYRLKVNAGETYTCETFDLSPGTDTNLIVYDSDRKGIGGNDDISVEETNKGNTASRFTWTSTREGFAYLLIGDVQPSPANIASERTYSLRCIGGLQGSATVPPIGGTRTETPTVVAKLTPVVTPKPTTLVPAEQPTQAAPPPFALNRNLPFLPLGVRSAGFSVPTATSSPVSTTLISVVMFVDVNANGILDAGEAIDGMVVHVIDPVSGALIDSAATDASGTANFAVYGVSPVLLQVPALGYRTSVSSPVNSIRLAVGARPELPNTIP